MSPKRDKDRVPPAPEPLDPASLGKLSDEDLMRRCQLGESESFDELFSRYEAPTLALLVRLVGERGAAEALAQEAFLRIYREADSYEFPRKFSTWFFTIVRNLAKNELRYRQRHPARSLDEPAAPATGARPEGPSGSDDLRAPGRTPLSGIVSKEVMQRLHKAIQELPEPEREALILHRFGNLKYREIADVLGTRLGTVRSRLHSALNRLRQALGEGEDRTG
jgi:RNA polymerase sigma-70 factor (ECF subfamily)